MDGQTYRVLGKERDLFQLQLVSHDLLQEFFVTKSDKEINALVRTGRLKHERDFFSKTLGYLRQRNDSSDLSDLPEDALRTIAWKTEWCVRFHRRRIDVTASWRPTHSPADLERFVNSEKGLMDRWYLDTYGERRRPGRRIKGKVRKDYDYPAPTTLRQWLALFRKHGERMEAFRPGYERCGNRNQMNALAASIVDQCVPRYATNSRPLMRDIYEDVEVALDELNATLPKHQKVYVSATAVRRRIRKIEPFLVEAGRLSLDRAIRKYTPVGIGLAVHRPMERIEMDDWEFDLQSLIIKTSAWRKLPESKRTKVPRLRCTATVAIDVATKCIVGFHLTPLSPSTQTAKSGLRSAMVDKSALARFAGCKSPWPMFGKPGTVGTDGGPAFQDEFREAVRLSVTNRILPDMDPRMRGTIEAFFRLFKRVCRYFAGQTFSSAVERGDYDSEKMASVTFEDTLKHAVRFIVDHYHHRSHRGLEGRTPYGEWARLSNKEGLELAPTARQLCVAFGYRDSRVIDKHGVLCMGLSYNSDELSILRARLLQEAVNFFVDPHDLGAILVAVPRTLREVDGLKGKLDGDCLIVRSVGDIASGRTLEQHLWARKEVREFAKAEEAVGRVFRLGAHRDLITAGDQARREAGLDSFGLTQKQFSYFSAALNQKRRAGFSAPQHPEVPLTGEDIPGELIVSKPKRPSDHRPSTSGLDEPDNGTTTERPFRSSMNLYEEDE
ncbi:MULTISPECIES: hypothetical protein [unclassified Bradyrhizobium]|uniref:hypothetical protein n=1 Tax=unclassified Bradyrhizobium TaxID=2631580 RepID=UPI0028EA1F2D|nr:MULTISPECIES: hypothetical protein [unclassified Bradyrhizobium]